MAEKPIITIERMTADDPRLDDKWAEWVKYALSLPGNSARADGLTISIQTRYGKESGPLLLPSGGTEFATEDDRNKAMDRIGWSSG